MNTMTDPAREIVEIFERLGSHGNVIRHDRLAEMFDVDPSSPEFYHIIFCIRDRINYLQEIVDKLEVERNIKQDWSYALNTIKYHFPHPLIESRDEIVVIESFPIEKVKKDLKFLSIAIQRHISYPSVSEDDVNILSGYLSQFVDFLSEIRLGNHDFIRRAIIEAVENFKFRLERIKWVGWVYTVASLRDVISAYYLLDGTRPIPGENPNAQVILKKTMQLLGRIVTSLNATNETAESDGFLLRIYGTAMIVHESRSIAGLISSDMRP